MGPSPVRRLVGPRAAARAAAAAAAVAEAASTGGTDAGRPVAGTSGARRSRPRLRVTVTRIGAPGPARHVLDTGLLDVSAALRLHDLVDAAEAPGAPAGPPGGSARRRRDVPGYEVTVARGYGHWTVRVADGAAPPPLEALIAHVVGAPSGVPEAG